MRIGIIDSGIDQEHTGLSECRITGVSLEHVNGNLVISDKCKDNIGHGTACAAVIHRDIPKAELVAVKIFHEELVSSVKLLCDAIKWCIGNNIDLINLSLGIQTSDPLPELKIVCEQAYRKNIVVVAAANNDIRLEAYPSYFPTTLGVTAGKIKERLSFGYLLNSPVEFVAKGTLQRVPWKNGGYTIMYGTSLACAHFTSIVALEMKSNVGKDVNTLKTSLINRADKTIQPLQFPANGNQRVFMPTIKPVIKRDDLQEVGQRLFRNDKKTSWMGRVAIFPASEKELKTLLFFPRSCSVNVTGFFDYPRSIKAEKTKSTQVAKIHSRMPSDSDFSAFDTFVVGYFFDHPFQANMEFGKDLVMHAITMGQNIFALDSSVKHYVESNASRCTSMVYVPEVNEELNSKVSLFRDLPSVKVPVLAVIGTGSQQGKFTTQMRIKEILAREGYRVSHLSTEPHGELFGADFSFPYGYKSTVFLRREKWSPFLRNVMKGMQEFNKPNIILTGIQRGVIPRGPAALGNETSSLDFMFGVQPDALICAISPEDSSAFIKDSVESARTFCKAKTVFFTLIPWTRNYIKKENGRVICKHSFLNAEEKIEKLDYFSQQLNATVLDIMDSNNDELILKSVQAFFS